MDSNSESVWYGAPPAPETMSAPEPQHEDERHVRLRTDARYFLLLSLALGAVFALLFVNAYALGLNAALLAAAMAAATLLALGKLGLRERKRDIIWSVSLVLLGLSIAWTANHMTQNVSFLGIFIAELLLRIFSRGASGASFPAASGSSDGSSRTWESRSAISPRCAGAVSKPRGACCSAL